MLEDLLTMTDIAVIRETITPDGMGDYTTTVTSTILSRGIIYQAGQGSLRYLSNKIVAESTHILVCEPSAYTFTTEDKKVTHKGRTFIIQGVPDDILGYGEILTVPLQEQV